MPPSPQTTNYHPHFHPYTSPCPSGTVPDGWNCVPVMPRIVTGDGKAHGIHIVAIVLPVLLGVAALVLMGVGLFVWRRKRRMEEREAVVVRAPPVVVRTPEVDDEPLPRYEDSGRDRWVECSGGEVVATVEEKEIQIVEKERVGKPGGGARVGEEGKAV